VRAAVAVIRACIAGLVLPAVLAAQAGTGGRAAGQEPPCAPIPAERGATIVFGRAGGNIRPRWFTIDADGRVSANASDSTHYTVATIPAGAVAALARLARSGGFWELRSPVIRRPTANPDASREFAEVTLTCGRHRAEFVSGAEPAAFSEFLALLTALARSP
jgi:hypothetical protein